MQHPSKKKCRHRYLVACCDVLNFSLDKLRGLPLTKRIVDLKKHSCRENDAHYFSPAFTGVRNRLIYVQVADMLNVRTEICAH
jgi:hypothetical protein